MPPRLWACCRLALRAVLPVNCLTCEQPLGADQTPHFCDACWSRIAPLSNARCCRCDQPFASMAVRSWTPDHRCQRCLEHEPAFERAWTPYAYIPPLQDAICALKYRQLFGLAKPLAGLLIRALPDEIDADVIVPVPLHPTRLRTREFNQSLLFADRVGKHLRRPVSMTDLVRTRATEPQTSLTRSERLRNLRRAFMVRNGEVFAGRRVLLVDDVFTTGTTLHECARTLRAAGATSVSARALARTSAPGLVPDRLLAEWDAGSFIGGES